MATIAEASASAGVPSGASRHTAMVEDAFTPQGDTTAWRIAEAPPGNVGAPTNWPIRAFDRLIKRRGASP